MAVILSELLLQTGHLEDQRVPAALPSLCKEQQLIPMDQGVSYFEHNSPQVASRREPLFGKKCCTTLDNELASLAQNDTPSFHNISTLVRKCSKEGELRCGLQLYDLMCQFGCESHANLRNSLVLMLLEVGSVHMAQQVVNKAENREDLPWNALILGYLKRGEFECALILYQYAQENVSIDINGCTFVALLKGCVGLGDVERGNMLYSHIQKRKSLEENFYVGSTLVHMYAHFGMLDKAQEVFDMLPSRNVVTWNALICGYVEHGHGEAALSCYRNMEVEGISADATTFVCSLKACGSLRSLENGLEIHTKVAQMGGLERDHVVGSVLVDMYAKCGCLHRAQEAFDMVSARDTVLWNALIAGYVDSGYSLRALQCIDQMRMEGVPPSNVTYTCSLRACGIMGRTLKGQEIHDELVSKGLEGDLLVSSALITMYSKCSLLADAHDVLDRLPMRSTVVWNALITGYAEQGSGEEALYCFRQMHLDGISPNVITFACSLKACGTIGALEQGQEIHAEIARNRMVETELSLCSSLVDMYAKCGALVKAKEALDKLPVRDTVAWTILMTGYADHEHGKEVLDCFEQMQRECILADKFTWACILKACGIEGAIATGIKSHAEIARRSLDTELVVGNALIHMYSKCGLLSHAMEVFDKLPILDTVVWTTLITGFIDHGYDEEALEYFELMHSQNVPGDAVLYANELKAYAKVGVTAKGQELHLQVDQEGFLERDPIVGSTLVSMYAKFGFMDKAQEMFDKLPSRDLFIWNALIAGYAQVGESEMAIRSFERMVEAGETPDRVTFITILNACSHVGSVELGQLLFCDMIIKYGIIPNHDHLNCVIDLFGRAGQLWKALTLLNEMPYFPDLVVWRTILSACRKWGDVELGKELFDRITLVNQKDVMAQICMYNIYTDAGMQPEAQALRVKRGAG